MRQLQIKCQKFKNVFIKFIKIRYNFAKDYRK